MLNNNAVINKQHLLWCLLSVCSFGLILYKARFGFGGDDEAFYLTIPQRLLYGDVFIKDEWHLSQLSAFLNIPFVWIYHSVTGGTEGIMLAARYYYVILHFILSFVIYLKLKNYGIFSVFASTIFFIFTPFNISAYSYNAMCVDSIVLMGVFMATASYKNKISYVLSGVFYAAAVLCCPYLAVIILLYFTAVIIEKIIKRKQKNHIVVFERKQFNLFCVGVFILATVFVLFVYFRNGFDNLFENLKLIMNDPEHIDNGILFKTKTYILDILTFTKANAFILGYYIIHYIVMLFDKKRKQHKSRYILANSIATVAFVLILIRVLDRECYHAILYPFALFGLAVYSLLEKKPYKLFIWVYLIGIIYSFAVNMSSNTCFYVIMMAMLVPNIATCIFMGQMIKELKIKENENIIIKRIAVLLMSVVTLFQIAVEMWSRMTICFSDGASAALTEIITQGPASGLITTKKNKLYYDEMYNDLQFYKMKNSENILCFTENTVSYLIVDFPFGTFSAWTSGANKSAFNRLLSYYEINERKVPEYIYIKKTYYNTRYDFVENKDFSFMLNRIEAEGYNKVEENNVSIKYERIN